MKVNPNERGVKFRWEKGLKMTDSSHVGVWANNNVAMKCIADIRKSS